MTAQPRMPKAGEVWDGDSGLRPRRIVVSVFKRMPTSNEPDGGEWTIEVFSLPFKKNEYEAEFMSSDEWLGWSIRTNARCVVEARE